MIKIGSLFSGIGGFELGLERAILGAETIWQVEQNTFCQKVLAKHWPDAKIYNDVRNITKDNVEPIDILCGGFPCQDISLAGKGKGLHGEKSGLWWEMLRIISELRPSIVVMENVAAVLIRGGCEVIGSLAEIGYCTEWTVISAREMGAPHLRRRWFLVGYTINTYNGSKTTKVQAGRSQHVVCNTRGWCDVTNSNSKSKSDSSYDEKTLEGNAANSNSQSSKKQSGNTIRVEQEHQLKCTSSQSNRTYERNYWQRHAPQSPVCRVDDGIPNRVDRLRALGNAIVPQCSEWVGQQIVKSGLLEDML